jgi:hypothetical protein
MGGRTGYLLGGLLLVLTLVRALPAGAQANPPGGGFDLPLDCPMWEVCSIQNYVDHDPGEGWADYTCGHLSYDGHRGTDFRVPTLIEMRQGVAVIAAAAGEVIVADDGIEDRLMQGTLAVQVGERVARGQKLGLIGLSGNSDFPHVHFAVSHGNQVLDPFTTQAPDSGCGRPGTSLWSAAAQAQLAYRSGGLLAAGFLDYQPSHRDMLAGIPLPAMISAEERTLVFWAAVWGLRKGDLEILQILRPDGSTFFHKLTDVEKNHAVWTKTFGLRQRDGDLAPGTYVGFYRVLRPEGNWQRTVLAKRLTIAVR